MTGSSLYCFVFYLWIALFCITECASVLADLWNLFPFAFLHVLPHVRWCTAFIVLLVTCLLSPLSSSKMMPRPGMQIPPRLPRATPNSAIPQNPVAIGGQQMPQVFTTGLSAGSQRCNPVAAYISGFTLEWRLSIIHTHLPFFISHFHPTVRNI